jgi:hypothetical protein
MTGLLTPSLARDRSNSVRHSVSGTLTLMQIRLPCNRWWWMIISAVAFGSLVIICVMLLPPPAATPANVVEQSIHSGMTQRAVDKEMRELGWEFKDEDWGLSEHGATWRDRHGYGSVRVTFDKNDCVLDRSYCNREPSLLLKVQILFMRIADSLGGTR